MTTGKSIYETLQAQVAAAGKSGGYCVLTAEEGQQLLELIEAQRAEFMRMEDSWRDEVQRVRDEYEDEGDYDDDPGPIEDRDCDYWERVFRDNL